MSPGCSSSAASTALSSERVRPSAYAMRAAPRLVAPEGGLQTPGDAAAAGARSTAGRWVDGTRFGSAQVAQPASAQRKAALETNPGATAQPATQSGQLAELFHHRFAADLRRHGA